MDGAPEFEIFLVATPGLEQVLGAEARALGFPDPVVQPGGVTVRGGWPEVWRANLELRTASRVLVRVGSFLAFHLAQLDKRTRKFPWAAFLRPDVPVRVEVATARSRIYHAGAGAERIGRAITEELGAPVDPAAEVAVKVRIDDNTVTISLDTSGESLHKRGHKVAVGKAPLRETIAAGVLSMCGFSGAEPVLDPMCGSGTFVIEAAEIASGLRPGRTRRFAFEALAGFDAEAWEAMRAAGPARRVGAQFQGSDRDAGAIRMSRENAERAGVTEVTRFECRPVGALVRPEGPPGLILVNPPYGARIGARKPLFGLHAALGQVLKAEFAGWRVGLVTSDPGLAKATGLPFGAPSEGISHGGLTVRLYRCGPLGGA